METYQIQEYNQTAAAISLLRDKYAGPFDTTTKEGMATAKVARAEVRGYRTTVEKLRVELKNPLLERGKLIDAEAKRITAELANIEEPIDAAIKAEERRKEEERAAKARAEAERVERIKANITAIRQKVTTAIGKNADAIANALDWARNYQPDPTDFSEYLPEAIAARNEVRAVLETMLNERRAADAEQARIKADREELARLRATVAALPTPGSESGLEYLAKTLAPPPELSAAPAPPTTSTKPNGRGKRAPALTPLQALIAQVKAGNCRFEDAIEMAYKLGYDDGVIAATTAQ